MSRSYKRAVFQLEGSKRDGKRFASKAVRRATDVPDGGSYKKVFCSWEITDQIADMRFGFPESWLPRGAVKTRSGWRVPK